MEWFLAEIIQQFTFANGDGPLVWINSVLVKANDIEEAYQKALKFGEAENSKYLNPDGVEVTSTFRGLKNLYLIYDKLEDGAELIYQEIDEITEEEITGMIKSKDELSVFKWHSSQDTESLNAIREGEPQ